MKTKQRRIAGLALSVVFPFLAAGCDTSKEAPSEPQLRPVRTSEVMPAPVGLERRFAGTTDSASTTDVSFRVSGTILDFPARVGTELDAGTVIAKLDDSDLRLLFERSQSLLEEARMQYAEAKSRYLRLTDLYERQAISAMDYDIVKSEYFTSQAKVTQAERDVELRSRELGYAVLTTPANGCSLSSSSASVNENISAGQTIATLNCGDTIEVTSVIPEAVVNTLTIGQDVQVLINSNDKVPLPARITEIGMSAGTDSLYFVTAQLGQSAVQVRPGMAAELLLGRKFDITEGHVWVPMVSVNEDQGQRYVMVYEGQGKTGLVRKVPVEVDRFAQGYFEITSGLAPGQRVITAGLNQIYDGMEVKLLPGDEQ